MTQVADFLLQPATGRATGSSPARDLLGGAAARKDSGQDFSRLLIQQRQQADQRPSAPAARPTPQPAPAAADNRTQQTSRQDPPVRPVAQASSQESNTDAPAATNETDTERQKADSSTAGAGQTEQQPGEDEQLPQEATADSSLPPGLLNPLLEQIRQSSDEEAELSGLEPEQDAAGVQEFLAMLGGAAPVATSTSETKLTGQTESPLEQINRLLNRGEQTKTGTAGEEAVRTSGGSTQDVVLDEALGEEGIEAKLQLLAGTAPRQENQSATGSVQSIQATRVEGAGEARTDTLMRSEAVQSAQAARQIPGQPLNMQQPGWSKELTDKVMWMSSQNLKSAEIKMNPAELGRLEIRVQVGQEHTQISFSSAHAGVRDSLDGQMHRLREMLEQQGMNNVDVEVSGQSPQQQEQQTANGRAGQLGDEGGVDEQQVAVTELDAQTAGHSGLVSHYV